MKWVWNSFMAEMGYGDEISVCVNVCEHAWVCEHACVNMCEHAWVCERPHHACASVFVHVCKHSTYVSTTYICKHSTYVYRDKQKDNSNRIHQAINTNRTKDESSMLLLRSLTYSYILNARSNIAMQSTYNAHS